MIKNKELNRRIVEISYKLKLGHIGSCLTAVDIIDEIYKIKKPDEKFVLSAGHAHLAHLVIQEKYITTDDHEHWQRDEKGWDIEYLIKKYGIHCDRQAGCDASSGSLGHGIGLAVGMALADRSKDVYCLLSDGEMTEGSVAEALQIADDQVLNHNLHIYVNDNEWGAYNPTIIDANHVIMGIKKMSFLNFHHVKTNMKDYPRWLQGQIAHYKVLNKEEYEELMDLLK
jgi:transketolase